jgi:hypothetical protein
VKFLQVQELRITGDNCLNRREKSDRDLAAKFTGQDLKEQKAGERAKSCYRETMATLKGKGGPFTFGSRRKYCED